jgi:hypothetical protein
VLVVVSSVPAKVLPKWLISTGFTSTNVALVAAFGSAASPLFYELCAEISYPTPEGVSAALMTFTANAVTLVFQLASPSIASTVFGIIISSCTAGLAALALVFLLCIRCRYARLDLDEGQDLGETPVIIQ